MKFTFTTLALLAASAVAAPAPEAEAWCDRPGQSCWKAKRAAEPEAWCDRPGQSCWKAKRDAEAEAWCDRPGQSCWKVKRAAEAFSRSLASSSSSGLEIRDDEPEADSVHALWCDRPGQSCWKAKRSMSDLGNFVSLTQRDPEAYFNDMGLETRFEQQGAVEKRDAEAEAEERRWCDRPGQSCWKAKRAAEAVIGAIDAADVAKRDALPEPEADADADAEWCDRPGQSCWKPKRDAAAWCDRPGQSCWKAKRDLNSIELTARNILETFA